MLPLFDGKVLEYKEAIPTESLMIHLTELIRVNRRRECCRPILEKLNDIICPNPNLFDHLTIRRCLVDLAMLRRDPEGRSYQTNQPVISSYITPDAWTLQPSVILEDVQSKTVQRQRLAGANRS